MSSIRMEMKLELIHRETRAINLRSHKERLYDGQVRILGSCSIRANASKFRIYRLADLYLLRNISRENRLMYIPRTQTIESYTAEYYGAEITGRAVVVKFHKGSLQVRRFYAINVLF